MSSSSVPQADPEAPVEAPGCWIPTSLHAMTWHEHEESKISAPHVTHVLSHQLGAVKHIWFGFKLFFPSVVGDEITIPNNSAHICGIAGSTSKQNISLELCLYMGVSENSVPLNPMVLLIIIPIKWLFHWEYTLFSDKPILKSQPPWIPVFVLLLVVICCRLL